LSRDEDARRRSSWQNTPTRRRLGLRFLVLAGFLLFLLAVLVVASPVGQFDDHQAPRFVYLLLLILVVVGSLAASRQRLSSIATQFAVWAAVILSLVMGYGLRHELSQAGAAVLADLMPSRGRVLDENTVRFARALDHHFWVDATVNGEALRFHVDTGATGVVLSREDATRLGFRPEPDAFSHVFDTANGSTGGAPIRLARLEIGLIIFEDVPAWVTAGDLRHSLLGMALLQRLTSVEISNDILTIRR
jgi:aspartyl protease family protein